MASPATKTLHKFVLMTKCGNIKQMVKKTFKAVRGKIWDLAFAAGMLRSALYSACVVGTILTLINHGDVILQGQFPPPIKLFLTYLTPFCVTTWGAYLGRRTKIIQQQNSSSPSCREFEE